VAKRVEHIRMFGTAAIDLAWVAEGRTDATIIRSNSIRIRAEPHP
jgi:myo-inositol-1(or 4)-monophosphatase